MKKCRSCQKEIDNKAKKCPYCQEKQGNWAQRHPIITGLIGIILFFIVIGAVGDDDTSSKRADSNIPTVVTESENTEQAETPQKSEFEVGEQIQMTDYILTVNEVTKMSSKGYSTPKSGHEYVIVNVTVQNQGTDEVTYNSFDFKIQNTDGNQTTSTYISLDDQLESGSLAENGKVTGSMAFEAPKGDTNLKLIYQPNYWLDDRRITVNLQ